MDFLRKFKLNIIPEFHSTSFAFAMAKNFPSITFFPHDIRYLNTNAKKILLILKKAGICHFTSKSVLDFVSKHNDKYDEWWNLKRTQHARALYCGSFAKIDSNRNKTLKDILFKEKQILLRKN